MEYLPHYSVLNREVVEFLTENFEEGDWYADLTFGAGGHTLSLAGHHPSLSVLSFDQDPEAFENGKKIIEEKNLQSRVNLVNRNFRDFSETVDEVLGKDFSGFKGVVMDLGVSSHHFDKADRGFSFRFEGPLDMRMDPVNNPLSAESVINEYSEESLLEILRDFGEERFARRIVENILEERKKQRITTTKELENIIFHAYPKKLRHSRAHPATKTFQSLRIEVNKELDVLSDVLPQIIEKLAPGGRVAVISFHSLEDRIAKHAFKKFKKENPEIEILTKRPILPTEAELAENSRSRSAKMRVLQRKLEKTEEKG